MQHRLLDEIAQAEVISAGVAPAAAVGVAVPKPGGWNVYTGAAGSISSRRQVDATTLFDLASLTKPFLAVLCAKLSQSGRLSWQTPLGSLLPEARNTPVAESSVEQLLSHRAGLAAHISLADCLQARRPVLRGAALERAALAVRPECLSNRSGAWHAPLYSDLGYVLVGAALEHNMRVPLDELLEKEVFNPLELRVASARQWLREGHFGDRVAATECVRWRGTQLKGVVHDDNCWALSGFATAGHAGLFCAVEPLLSFGTAMVDALTGSARAFLTHAAAAFLVQPRPGGTLRCGFDGKASTGASAGSSAGSATFGHLGYTGTSIWCDPDARLVTVLLTNRVNPTHRNFGIRGARPAVHEQLFQLGRNPAILGESCGGP